MMNGSLWKWVSGVLAALLASLATGSISYQQGVNRVDVVYQRLAAHLTDPKYHETLSIRTDILSEIMTRDRTDLSQRLDRLEEKVDRLLESK